MISLGSAGVGLGCYILMIQKKLRFSLFPRKMLGAFPG